MPAQPCQQPGQGIVLFQVPLSGALGMLRISAWTFSVRASPGDTIRRSRNVNVRSVINARPATRTDDAARFEMQYLLTVGTRI